MPKLKATRKSSPKAKLRAKAKARRGVGAAPMRQAPTMGMQADEMSVESVGLQQLFEQDDEATPSGKNSRLSDLLQGPWNPLKIIRIERIEQERAQGWQAEFSEDF